MHEIVLKNVSFEYPVYGTGPKLFTNKLMSLASAGIINSNDKYKVIKSLDAIDLDLKPGDRLGIVGGNGAGKTTLLKIIAGIYTPTSGTRYVKGRITTLITTGFGFDEEAVGYQNIILGGLALGFNRREMIEKFDDIEKFTELGNFLDMPIKTYSAGMKVRLAFAIATSLEPEILIIDEGIGAGDAEFYEKAQGRIKNFFGKASILIMASHADNLLSQFCNRGLYMSQGRVLYSGCMESTLEQRYKQISNVHTES